MIYDKSILGNLVTPFVDKICVTLSDETTDYT